MWDTVIGKQSKKDNKTDKYTCITILIVLTIFATSATRSSPSSQEKLNASTMADLDCAPFWTHNKAWDIAIETESSKVHWDKTFASGRKMKSEVLPSSGEFGIEFLMALTLPQFKQAIKEQEWNNLERYSQLLKVLHRTLKTAWEETLETDYPLDNDHTKENWPKAIH